MKQSVFCFGELLLRMSPELGRQWIEHTSMPIYVGGAELNVSNALAKWGLPVKYGTALPDHYLSREITAELQEKKINTSAIHFSGERIGIYYLPLGTDLKSAGVIYDRAGSSFAELRPGMVNWDEALKDCTWFHFSAINPALNQHAAAVCKEAVEAAAEKGLTISVDLNYRSKLWKYGKLPKDILPELVEHCHIIMGNIWSAESLLGIEAIIKDSENKTREALTQAALDSMQQIQDQFTRASYFAYTFRLPKEYWALLKHGDEHYISKSMPTKEVADKAGSGDCFMAGIIYGIYHQHRLQQTIDFAAAAASGKLMEKGDATCQTVEMINAKLQ